jgi:glycine oxidase
VLDDGARVVGVRCVAGPESGATERAADTVLVAAGAHSAGLHPALHGLVRPVKGEILRLALRPGAFPAPRRTVRALVDGRPVYMVPRADGLVLGATQSEVGFDTTVTVGGVRDLLRDAERILPGIAEYALVESAAGLRPGSPDNLPLIGAIGPEGLLVATGHHRNGMLLAPVTADAVAALLRGEAVPGPVRVADPARFVPAAPRR